MPERRERAARIGEQLGGGDAEQPPRAVAHVDEIEPAARVGGELEHHAGQVRGERAEALLAFGEPCLGIATMTPRCRSVDRAIECRLQAAELVLHQVVVGAAAHRFDRGFLADRAGYDQERQIAIATADDRERLERREAGQTVVGDDRRPAAASERAFERGRGLDALTAHRAPGSAQPREQQLVVVERILDDDQVECGPGRRGWVGR